MYITAAPLSASRSIQTIKTEVQNIGKEPKNTYTHTDILIMAIKELTQVDNFTYLGGIISQDGSNSQDI